MSTSYQRRKTVKPLWASPPEGRRSPGVCRHSCSAAARHRGRSSQWFSLEHDVITADKLTSWNFEKEQKRKFSLSIMSSRLHSKTACTTDKALPFQATF